MDSKTLKKLDKVFASLEKLVPEEYERARQTCREGREEIKRILKKNYGKKPKPKAKK